jgi:hypothetical protein
MYVRNCHQAPLRATDGVRENVVMKGSPYIISAAKTTTFTKIIAMVRRIISNVEPGLYYLFLSRKENKKIKKGGEIL